MRYAVRGLRLEAKEAEKVEGSKLKSERMAGEGRGEMDEKLKECEK